MCGETCILGGDGAGGENYGLINAKVSGGYHSTVGCGKCGALDDLRAYRFSLCEFCLEAIFDRCAVPPEVFEYSLCDGDEFPTNETWLNGEQRIAQDSWRKSPEHYRAERARRAGKRNE